MDGVPSTPFEFSLISGSLPSGLTLSGGGLIAGRATGAGTFIFTVKAVDATGFGGSREYSLMVGCSYSLNPDGFQFPAAGGTGLIEVGTLAGCQWSAFADAGWISLTVDPAGTIGVSIGVNFGAARTGRIYVANQTIVINQVAARRMFFDFDGDGKADISVFRPENGSWYIQQSAVGFAGLAFGAAADKIVPADYDGDGKTDIAVYRSGVWYLQRSAAGFTGIRFGDGNDVPVPADYDGDGKAELAVFRPSNGCWYLLNLSTNQFTATLFGISTDQPVPSDYDGDGKTDIAVNRNGNWYIQRSQLGFTGTLFGDSNDKLVPADYDGDGKTDIAVFRPSSGTWYIQQSAAGFTGIAFGLGTDIPVAADYDGDGRADLAVVRNGNWYLNRTTQGFTDIQFGTNTDLPIPNAFVK